MTRRPVPFRGGGFAPRSMAGLGFLAMIGLVALWQAGASLGFIPSLLLPAPVDVGRALLRLVHSGDLIRHLTASLYRLALGWTIGTAAGLVIGLAIGLSTVARSIGQPLAAALFPIPKIALLPLFIVWFGIDEPSKVATIAFGALFPTVIATYGAVDGVPRNLVRMGQSFGLSTAGIVRRIVLPGALAGILSGFRISTSIAIVLLVAAEMIGAEWGIGALVLNSGASMQTDILIAGVVVLSLIGLTLSAVIGWLERYLLAWR